MAWDRGVLWARSDDASKRLRSRAEYATRSANVRRPLQDRRRRLGTQQSKEATGHGKACDSAQKEMRLRLRGLKNAY